MASDRASGEADRQRLGLYEVFAKIADGGMAAVHVARKPDGELVAIKRIREEYGKNKEFLTMLLDEAKIVSYLHHPNIVRYFELGREDGQAFIAMELLLGQSLWSVWEACRMRGMRLRYDMIAWIGARVADGLHYAHELGDAEGAPLGIVHRDVNATNIFVTYDGDIKIIDFGLAKAANRASKTAAGIIKGKVAYMSPEQAVGAPVDRRTDVFALATTLWEIACDRRLFKHADEMETLKRVHAAEVPDATHLVDGFPPALWDILRRGLSRSMEDRQQTAAELSRQLDTFAAGAVGPAAVADAMRELFTDDRNRQLAWLTNVDKPDFVPVADPLKPPSTFWSGEDIPISVAEVPPPSILAPIAHPPTVRQESVATFRRLLPIIGVIVLVTASVVITALALR